MNSATPSILKNKVEESPVDFERFERESPKRKSQPINIFNPSKIAHHEVIKSDDSIVVKIRLPPEVLLEINYKKLRRKPPSVIRANAAKREKQIFHYNSTLKEERAVRRAMRMEQSSSSLSSTEVPSSPIRSNDTAQELQLTTSPKKKVNFNLFKG